MTDNWRIARSLDRLRAQVNAAYPGRSKGWDGDKGDDAHAARVSDHNPDKDDVVHALDITHDPARGFDSYAFADHLLAARDDRVRYVISNRRIAGNADYAKNNPPAVAWEWRHYGGENAHDHHVHVSVVHDARADDARNWDIGPIMAPRDAGPLPLDRPVLRSGSSGDDVRRLQTLLGVTVDGAFGPATKAAVQTFQREHALVADGVVGGYTWKALEAGQVQPEAPAEPLPPVDRPAWWDAVLAAADASPVIAYNWKRGTGRAPRGGIRGLALAMGYVHQRFLAGDPAEARMAAATGRFANDALVRYAARCHELGLVVAAPGPDILAILMGLATGLAGRESGWKFCEGRDITAKIPPSAASAETGMFQTSYGLLGVSPLLKAIWDEALRGPDDPEGLAPIFHEGVTCTPLMLSNTGSGPGAEFQRRTKASPLFAVRVALLGMRLNGGASGEWGPLRRGEAELTLDAVQLARSVQAIVGGVR